MASLKIKGGGRLQGEIIPQGAKNEAMQILCACLLTDEKVTIHNLPDILDINNLIALLEGMGVTIERPTRHDIILQAKSLNFDYFKGTDYQSTASKLRGSVMMTGPMLARFGRPSCPSLVATKSVAADSTPTSSAYRNSVPSLTSTAIKSGCSQVG